MVGSDIKINTRSFDVVRVTLTLIVIFVLIYTLRQAWVLRIEYWDGYDYLRNARALLGDPLARYWTLRPPFVPIAQLPAVSIALASAPASPLRLIAPHLTSAVLAMVTALAIFCLFRATFGVTLALLGTVLFVTTRYFIHYAPYAMPDIPSAGWAAATIALYARARQQRSWGAYVLCGLAVCCAALSKYPLAVAGLALALAEGCLAIRERRFDRHRWLGLALAGSFALLLFLAVQATLMLVLYRADWFHASLLFVRQFFGFYGTYARLDAPTTELWSDYGPMTAKMISIPTLLVGAWGLLLAIAKPEDRDIPFLAWLGVVGGTIVFVLRHNEARYLLPAVPSILYFSLRGVEATARMLGTRRYCASPLWRTVPIGTGVVLLGGSIWVGIHQAMLDQDPVFRADEERLAAERMLSVLGPRGRLLWFGTVHTLHARWAGSIPYDEYLGSFTYAPFQAEYFTGKHFADGPRPWPKDLTTLPYLLNDGDAILRTSDKFFTALDIPPGGVRPMEVWAVHRRSLLASGAGRFVDSVKPQVSLQLREAEGLLFVSSDSMSGTWTAVAGATPSERLRLLGEVTLGEGGEAFLGVASAQGIRSLEMFHFERATLP